MTAQFYGGTCYRNTRAIIPLSGFGTRVDINDIEPDDPYIEKWFKALRSLKAMADFKDEMSYFRLAAIHGAPYVGWDGEGSPGPHDPSQGNFCVHGDATFPTWHRIYMILFERALSSHISDESFRMPYWDWAKNDKGEATPLPLLLASQAWPPTEFAVMPDPEHENPLWRFVNPKTIKDDNGKDKPCPFGDITMWPFNVPNDGTLNWSTTSATSRCVDPKSDEFITGHCNMNVLLTNFQNAGWYAKDKGTPYASISDYVYLLLSWQYTNFDSFACTKFKPVKDPKSGVWMSLEYLHNNIHNWIGGNEDVATGHMCDVPVAAFDPIFWLHHTFIDALFAEWQKLNPGLWLSEIDAKKPLVPFHKDVVGTCFTSDDLKDITKWNYNYSTFPTKKPEVELDVTAAAEEKTDLIGMINDRYGNNLQHVPAQWEGMGITDFQNDYYINVLYDRHALDMAYNVNFFLKSEIGLPAELDGLAATGFIGSVFTFSNSGKNRCANCVAQQTDNVLQRATIILNVPLNFRIQNKELNTLTLDGDDGVEAYLKTNLTWNVVKINGQEVPLKLSSGEANPMLKDLKIILIQGQAKHRPDDRTRLSTYYVDTYKAFWQGNAPHEESEPDAEYLIQSIRSSA